MARLEHPNLVRIYETGETDGRPYFSMEYVDGGRLADSLRGTPMSPRRAAQLAETLARATHAAHERGVIHRDLTPSNVLLTSGGEPKIVDFGLAKLTIGGAGRTETGDILGTPSYMAPEQATGQSKEVGPAADVYALGAILYEMLTGRPPFKGESVLDTLAQVVNDEPVAPCRLQPKVPRDLETICLKCLNKEPDRRYSSAAALAEDLGRYLAGEPVRARPIGAAGRAVRWARRRPAVASLLAVCATGAIAAFAAVTWEGRQARLAQGRAEQAEQAEQTQRVAAETARVRETRQRRLYQGLSAVLLRDRACATVRMATSAAACSGWRRACDWSPTTIPTSSARSAPTSPAGNGRFTRFRLSSNTRTASWRPPGAPTDGLILTAGADKTARLWDAATGADTGRR